MTPSWSTCLPSTINSTTHTGSEGHQLALRALRGGVPSYKAIQMARIRHTIPLFVYAVVLLPPPPVSQCPFRLTLFSCIIMAYLLFFFQFGLFSFTAVSRLCTSSHFICIYCIVANLSLFILLQNINIDLVRGHIFLAVHLPGWAHSNKSIAKWKYLGSHQKLRTVRMCKNSTFS